MLPVAEADYLRLNGGAVARPVDLFSDVSVKVQVVQDDLADGVIGESLVARNLKEVTLSCYSDDQSVRREQARTEPTQLTLGAL